MSQLIRVVRAIESIAPLSLSESWDNTGLLVEAPYPRQNANTVLLTIDLTLQVLYEALRNQKVGIIISYHPPLFSKIKRLVLSDIKQQIVLKCIASGISIYSPHTALDSCEGGINDWLLKGLGSGTSSPIAPSKSTMAGQLNSGSGRILRLDTPISLDEITLRIKSHLNLRYVRRAQQPQLSQDGLIEIIAVCAGSGSGCFGTTPADLYLTGEMGHHDVLAALARNTSVILCEHTNTERGYLKQELQPKLNELLSIDGGSKIEVICSIVDEDPLKII